VTENDSTLAVRDMARGSKHQTILAARQSGDQLSPDALRLMLAMYRLQMQLAKRRKRLKKRADRPAPAARPIVRRGKRQRRDRIDVARPPPLRARQPLPGSRSPAPRKPVWFPPAARAVCQLAPLPVAAIAPEAEAPPPESMDDIERAYAEECGAIMKDFAQRLAGAKTPGERRAIKTARKSAMAAAKEKAKMMKASRKAGNMAARQTAAPRRPRPPVEPRPV
jgi:hypothetical protein